MGSKTKSSAKHGRNRKSGQNLIYKAENRREKSHVKRIRCHLKRFGMGDQVSREALVRYAGKVGLNALSSAKHFLGVK